MDEQRPHLLLQPRVDPLLLAEGGEEPSFTGPAPGLLPSSDAGGRDPGLWGASSLFRPLIHILIWAAAYRVLVG